MKRNAIIRIIAWTVSLVILVGILVAGMSWRYNRSDFLGGTALIEATQAHDSGDVSRISALLTEDSWLLRSPDPGAEQKALLSAGTAVSITRQELVNGNEWVFVDSPESGWLLMSSLNTKENSTETEKASVDAGIDYSADVYVLKPHEIRDFKIDWLAGSIRILSSTDAVGIEVQESEIADSRYKMVCRQDGSTLKIAFCDGSFRNMLKMNPPKKDLTILVPKDFSLKELEIDAASADLSVQNLSVQEVSIDTASGKNSFENCKVDTLDIDTASGDVYFEGSLNKLDCDSASAGVQAVLSNVPYEIDVDTASGDLVLFLPEDAGFSVKMDTMSGKFDSSLTYTVKDGRYIRGNGACNIDISSMSSDVTIRSK